jgi:hypothetical protein
MCLTLTCEAIAKRLEDFLRCGWTVSSLVGSNLVLFIYGKEEREIAIVGLCIDAKLS